MTSPGVCEWGLSPPSPPEGEVAASEALRRVGCQNPFPYHGGTIRLNGRYGTVKSGGSR